MSERDIENMRRWIKNKPDTKSVAKFVANDNIAKLDLCFDIEKLVEAFEACLAINQFSGDYRQYGFEVLQLTKRKNQDQITSNDLSGRYWLRNDQTYIEEPREELVDESAFSEFNPDYAHTYFKYVHQELSKHFKIGRVRILFKDIYNCNSWHRDPEPRLHIPIISNPGSLFIVNHHVTHLPADGSVYFTDTRAYHTGLNGGESRRVHLVVALAY
ncbi:MAG: hypothetical protein AAF403_02050 [Pseudomonadota bacterium]